MKKIWFDEAWEDYLYWQLQDKKTLKRVNQLLKDIEREPFSGIGKPEPLKGELFVYGGGGMKKIKMNVDGGKTFEQGCHSMDEWKAALEECNMRFGLPVSLRRA